MAMNHCAKPRYDVNDDNDDGGDDGDDDELFVASRRYVLHVCKGKL
jgi:hypothetical protein